MQNNHVWRYNRLPRRNDKKIIPNNNQMSLQQHCVKRKSKIHDSWRQKILPRHPNGFGPRLCDPSSLYKDSRVRDYDNLIVWRPTEFSDGDGIKTTNGKGKWEGGGGVSGYPERLCHDQIVGEGKDLGRATSREWRLSGTSPLRAKIHPIGYRAPEDVRRRSKKQGWRDGDTRYTEGPKMGENPRRRQVPRRRPRAARGSERIRDTAAEAGMLRGAQRQAAEAGGWKVWVNYRLMSYRAGRVGGDQFYRYWGDGNECYWWGGR